MERSAIEWATEPLRKYANFEGRARRSEYWWFTLLFVVILIAASLVDAVLGLGLGMGFGVLYIIVAFALFVPSLAVGIRRLHDSARSGWWYLIALVPLVGGIVLLIFLVSDGTSGTNRFGPDSKGRAA